MKKAGKRIWIWILSGAALLMGVSCHFNRPPSTLYGPPEELYGPPTPEMEYEQDTIPTQELEEEMP